MNIHVKIWDENFSDSMIGKIVGMIRKYDCEKHVYFMTVNDRIIREVKRIAPDICVCVGWDGNKDPMSIVERAITLSAEKVQLYKPYFNQQTIDVAHEHGIICNVFWADEPMEAVKYRKMGIDCILTNDYLTIKNALK